MRKTIYQKVEAIIESLKSKGGEAIIITHDPDSDHMQLITLAHDIECVFDLFLNYLVQNKELIPTILQAASIAIEAKECDGDCENCDMRDDCDEDEDFFNPNLN